MVKTLRQDFGLRSKAKVTVDVSLLASAVETYCFAFDSNGPLQEFGGTTALILEVDGFRKWVLALEGSIDTSISDGVFACPSPNHLLTIVDSSAFYIDCRYPGAVEPISEIYVRKVEPNLQLNMIFLIGYHSLAAIGENGVQWVSKRLVRDGLVVSAITKEKIFGSGDLSQDMVYGDHFELDTQTGCILSAGVFTEGRD